MRICLVVSGTRGDVQPLAVLGAGLVRAGHDALLLAPPENALLAGRLGCPFEAFGADVAVDARSDVHVCGAVPHAALFPRVAAVVHHGGAGTTATAARAGVPQVIVPHMTDQYYAANRVAALGVGPRPVWKARLTTGRLTAALRQATGDETMRQRCAALREALHARPDPLAAAIAAIAV